MRIVGLVVVALGLAAGIGSNIPPFVDPPSLIIIATFVLGVLWIAGTPVGQMLRAVFASDLSSVNLGDAARGWELARTAAVVAGITGTVVGAVIMAKNLDDLADLGPGLAIAVLTIFYGLLVGYGICLPCQYYVERRSRA